MYRYVVYGRDRGDWFKRRVGAASRQDAISQVRAMFPYSIRIDSAVKYGRYR